MSSLPGFRLEDFEYHLPDELIAQSPPAIRHGSRLLWVDKQASHFSDRMFSDLPELLKRGDLLIVNDTKVIPARLLAKRASGGSVEILLLRPEPTRPGVWLAMATPLRKLKASEHLTLDDRECTVKVDELVTGEDGQRRVILDFGSQENVYRTLAKNGLAPLPPYIRRSADSAGDADEQRNSDLGRYQTIFANAPGAVAAPTAGLHFSEEIFARLQTNGIEVQKLTLHVGPGTFKPIVTSVEEHSIEAERFSISQETADAVNAALSEGRRVVAVGTTSCRALETAGAEGTVKAVNDAATSLYIRPGYKFKVVSGMVTNFHLSRSSLLVLVSSFAGHELIMGAYKHAVASRYRFFSYGDAMLII